ncbi:MAG: RDD family protein [Vicingaceae bacterium]|nr:RDD family protein [Vicingaceae bacterium]
MKNYGRRFGAYMLDLLISLVFGGFIATFVGEDLALTFFAEQLTEVDGAMTMFANSDMDIEAFMLKTFGYSAAVSLLVVVFFIMEGALGQSPGKMLLQIVNTNTDGAKADAGSLWLRAALKYGSTLLSLIGGIASVAFIGTIGSFLGLVIFIGFFFAFGDKKQTIHDMIAKTVVSRK